MNSCVRLSGVTIFFGDSESRLGFCRVFCLFFFTLRCTEMHAVAGRALSGLDKWARL